MKLPPGRSLRRLALAALILTPAGLFGQGVTVTGHVSLVPAAKRARAPAAHAGAVVWLTPLDQPEAYRTSPRPDPAGRFRLLQKDKRFTPHILVVPAGAVVEFPNDDPFFHNVFSLFNGKRFDLGLYEAGATRTVTFSAPGICYIFCNIHPEMSAVVVVTRTPYHAVSGAAGDFAIVNVPPGRYKLNVWDEHCLPEALKALAREVSISPSSFSLGDLRLPESRSLLSKHKNLYGRDYDATPASNPIYGPP
ncbi:MAG TPA: carboxypeptidase regulatory-like domain-containing protein [Terriglobia bacterium]|nr:carboxypeptidase regulatory-like domain-containing protein [Terriglobia bacterium]